MTKKPEPKKEKLQWEKCRWCPRYISRSLPVTYAISRFDNSTLVCSSCGRLEAFLQLEAFNAYNARNE